MPSLTLCTVDRRFDPALGLSLMDLYGDTCGTCAHYTACPEFPGGKSGLCSGQDLGALARVERGHMVVVRSTFRKCGNYRSAS